MRPLALLIVLALIPLKILGVFGITLSRYVLPSGNDQSAEWFREFREFRNIIRN
jgi:hypothetical protein